MTSSISTPASPSWSTKTLGLVHVLLQRLGNRAVLHEGEQRGLGHGIDGVGADEGLGVHDVAVFGVLGGRACPEGTLDPRALRCQGSEAGRRRSPP